MKRDIVLCLVLAVGLAACGPTESPAADTSPPDPVVVAATRTEAPAPTATGPVADSPVATEPAAPTNAPPMVDTPADSPAAVPATEMPEPTAVPVEPETPPADVVVNGQNPDGTFFRGWSTAPVTLFEYSDFL